MTGRCNEIQATLSERGPTAFQGNAAAQEHLAECEACHAVLLALGELDAAVEHLPQLDVSDATVEALIGHVRGIPHPLPASAVRSRRLRARSAARSERKGWGDWWERFTSPSCVAAMTAVCVTILIIRVGVENISSDGSQAILPLEGARSATAVRKEADRSDIAYEEKRRSLRSAEKKESPAMPLARGQSYAANVEQGYIAGKGAAELTAEALAMQDVKKKWKSEPGQLEAPVPDSPAKSDRLREKVPPALRSLGYIDYVPEVAESEVEEIVIRGTRTPGLVDVPIAVSQFSAADIQSLRIKDVADLGQYTPNLEIDTSFEGSEEEAAPPEPNAKNLDELRVARSGPVAERAADLQDFDGITFQPASGYWSNAYVPGDPKLRLLQAELADWDPSFLQRYTEGPLQLHRRAQRVSQPFDAPADAAVEVFLHSDRTGLEEPERLTLQVGIQGALRQGGLRPPMNVGVVLDLRSTPSREAATPMRAIVDAFRQAREIGDRFSLRAAGRSADGVEAQQFEHGPLSVAMEGWFGASESSPTAPGLVDALEAAIDAVRAGDDPDAPLGSSMVVLVTSQPLGGELERAMQVAHESAVAGVPVSVVGVGTEVELDEIDRLVLSGQGNRRLLTASDEARGVVDRELSALSRAVARALRLRIRLAPGVRLIDVLDAHRLDREGEEHTRAAEQSIDLRMARDLGIEADRGEDEEGIQIVIPSFYAGDSHTILLDVVAKGPGPIADVTLRYKDLIYQKNGVARAQLKLSAESASMGPLEDNVRKNVLAVRLSNRLERVADTLRSRDDVDARQQLEAEHAWIVSARSRIPAFQNDVELAADLTMLEEYLALIQEKPLSHPGVREELALSLQLAGIYKRLPRPRAD